MNLLDRVRLLVRSTIGGNFPDIAFTPDENGLKLLDKAQARIEILQADIARAEKRGDDELAARLKREVDALQKTVNRARKKLGQPVTSSSSSAQAQPAASASASQPDAKAQQTAPQTAPAVESAQAEDNTEDQPMDDSRVADQIRKAREGKP